MQVLTQAHAVFENPGLAASLGQANPPDPVASSHGFEWANTLFKTFYHQTIIPLAVVTALLAWRARPSTEEEIPAGFRKFRFRFLIVWAFCAGADWLQGPYVYALYAAYGYSRHEIAELFVAGFGSSLVFSCVVGTLVDRYGRKKCALAYCVLYIVSCLTKHVGQWWWLILGRITGGMATSLLFSCFECWLVSEHLGRHCYSSGLLSYMFGMMYTTNYCVAIIAGILGQVVSDSIKFQPLNKDSPFYVGGALAPFDLSIVCLVIGAVLILALWPENYGQTEARCDDAGSQGRQQGLAANCADALTLLRCNRRVWTLGLVVACFEGSTYAFVFNWTPALNSKTLPPPEGVIMSLFMMACMCGASVSTLMADVVKPAARLISICCVGACALAVAAVGCGLSWTLVVCFTAFCVFEFCVGVYYPSVGFLKSEVVPERVRGTVYNLYRVPLNAVVVGLLLTDMSVAHVLRFSAVLVALALPCAVAQLPGISCRSREPLSSCGA